MSVDQLSSKDKGLPNTKSVYLLKAWQLIHTLFSPNRSRGPILSTIRNIRLCVCAIAENPLPVWWHYFFFFFSASMFKKKYFSGFWSHSSVDHPIADNRGVRKIGSVALAGIISDKWHVTHDTWHVTGEAWHMTCVIFFILIFFTKFASQKATNCVKVHKSVNKNRDFIVSLLLSALVERSGVSRVQDFVQLVSKKLFYFQWQFFIFGSALRHLFNET